MGGAKHVSCLHTDDEGEVGGARWNPTVFGCLSVFGCCS